MRSLVVIPLVAVLGCSVDFSERKAPDPTLAHRIAQKQNVVMQNPADTQAQLELGELLIEGEQWFEAAEAFKTAHDAGARDVRVHAGLTTSYFALGYFKAGIESLKNCIQTDRNNPDCLLAYAQLVSSDSSDKAQQELRQVYIRFLAVAPDHKKVAFVKSSLEQLNAKLGPMDFPPQPEAPASQPASQPAPPPTEAPVPGHPGGGTPKQTEDVGELNPFGQAIMQAMNAVQNNDAPAAEAAFRKALTIRPGDPSALAGLAETQFAQNNQKDAVATIEKAYAADPKDPQVRWAFGLIMMRNQKRLPDAVAAWEALAKDDPEYAARLKIPERLEQIRKFSKPK